MLKIRKEEPNLHVVFPDTNILWHESKDVPVHPDFESFWAAHDGQIQLELVLPSVVLGELLFQHCTSANKILDKISLDLNSLSGICSKKHSNRITGDKIKNQIDAKFQKWLKEKSATIIDAPISTIDWNSIIEKAIWRKPPFSLDPKNPRLEKGFRDAIILESWAAHAKNDTRNVQLTFITNDHLLRSSLKERLKQDSRCLFFDSLSDFASHIKLTKEQLTKDFIKGLVERASEKFFVKDDQSSLCYREKITSQIVELSKDRLVDPDGANKNFASIFGKSLGATSKWQRASGAFWVGSTQFENLREPREFHWNSGITYVSLFRKSEEGEAPSLFPEPDNKLLLIECEILWWANIKSDGRFHNITLDKVSIKDTVFREPSQEDRIRYELGGLGQITNG